MEFLVQNNTCVVQGQPDPVIGLSEEFRKSVQHWQDYHVILDARGCALDPLSIYDQLQQIIKAHKSNQKSFIIVDEAERLRQYPEECSGAPTHEEAFDLIEMEDIERDLGF